MTEDLELTDSIRYSPPAVMTLEEVAVYLGFAVATVRRMLRDREMPAAKVAGQWRFLTAEVDRWLADLSKQPVAPAGQQPPASGREAVRRLVQDYKEGLSPDVFLSVLKEIPDKEDIVTNEEVDGLLASLFHDPPGVFTAKLKRVFPEAFWPDQPPIEDQLKPYTLTVEGVQKLAFSRDGLLQLARDFEDGKGSVDLYLAALQAIPRREDVVTEDQVLPLLKTLPAQPPEAIAARLEQVRAEVASKSKKGR